MYEQYIRIYKHYAQTYGPQTAVFLLVGSFYELYDYRDSVTNETQTSMERAIELMGIQLKIKKGDAPGGADGYFGGVPEESLDKFASILTRANWTVVVCKQEKDKRTGKIQKERPVARILSAGTHTEVATGSRDSVWLGGLWLEAAAFTEGAAAAPPSFGAVAVDLTTGTVMLYQGAATGRRDGWFADDLLHFFQVHAPRELLVWWRGDAVDAPTEDMLRRTLGIPAAQLHAWPAAKAGSGIERPLVREDLLRNAFQPKTLLPLREVLSLAHAPLAEKGLVATLEFIGEHASSALSHLHTPLLWNPRDTMLLANHALTQLNMISGTAVEEGSSVLGLFLKTQTSMGRRAMRQRLLTPVCQPAVLEARYTQVGWWHGTAGPVLQEELRATLRHIQDLPRLHRRIATAQTDAADVLALDQSYRSAARLAGLLESSPLAMAPALATSFEALREAFAAAFDVEKAAIAEDVFCLMDTAGPRTAAVEARLAETKGKITALVQQLEDFAGEVAGSGARRERGTFKLERRETGLFLAGTKAALGRILTRLREAGSTAPATLQGATVHAKKASSTMELPALTALHRATTGLREELKEVAREEVGPLCSALAAVHTRTWDALEAWIATADVTGTLAAVAAARGFCRPELVAADSAGSLEIEGLRHPLIEAQQTRIEYVRHDVQLGSGNSPTPTNGWLVYGMNASGKSSLMKAVGIAVLLAQAGSFVPAARMRLSPFRALFTRILNTDNLWAGLSSFAVEMTELREILRRADSGSLVLGDEVCSGTESVSATALVAATLKAFESRGVRYIFATHLHGLQSLPEVTELPSMRTWHLRVRYDAAADRLVYERTLHPGAGSTVYGLEVAKAMAIPFEILEDAHAMRRRLMGTEKGTEAASSEWNAVVTRRACELCSADLVRDLEVHHIRPRATAGAGGRLADGSHMNALRNLVVVCQRCHDRHHAGELQIGQMQQTSEGPVREVLDLGRFAYTPAAPAAVGGLTEAQKEVVWSYLRQFPTVPPSRALFDLEQKGISLTAQRLRTLRGQMPIGALLA